MVHNSGQSEFLKTISWLLPPLFLFLLYLRLNAGAHPPHMDEYDYLFVGRHLLSGLTWPTHSYIFGSDLSWYLYGFFDKYAGGHIGARIAAILVGGLSLLGFFVFVFQLWSSKHVALLSTLMLAASANHIFISTMATYDIISFCFFTWALATALYTAKTESYMIALLSAALLSLAIISKYTTILYLPFIGIVMLYSAPRQALAAGVAIAAMLAVYVKLHFIELSVLYEQQIVGVHSANSTRSDIAVRVFKQLGLMLYFWICAIVVCSLRLNRKLTVTNKVLVILLVFSLPMPFYHFYSGNHISLFKHLNFSALFLIPATAWVLVEADKRISSESRQVPILLAAFAVAYMIFNTAQLGRIKNAYPDTTALSQVIAENINDDSTILSENPYIFRYLASDVVPQYNIKETTWLDNNHDGIRSSQDVKDALWDRKFELVLLTDQIHENDNPQFRSILSQRGYIPIYSNAYQLSSVMTKITQGKLTLYKRL